MGSMLKDDGDKVTLRVQGGGPAGVLIACTDGTGNVKGCIDNPLVELPPKADGHLDVGGAVGRSGVPCGCLFSIAAACKKTADASAPLCKCYTWHCTVNIR